MAENNNQPYQSPQDNDDVLFCCKKLTTNQRKIGFYITLLIGLILYITAIINFFGSIFGSDVSYMYALLAALITLLCPLWMSSPSQLFSGLRDPSRKMTILILIISVIGLFTFRIFDVKLFALIFVLTLISSGIWLSLTYYQNGQESLLEFLKKCFNRNKDNNNLNNNNNFNNNDGNNV